MSREIILGPILGLESDTDYTVVFITRISIHNALIKYNGKTIEARQIGQVRSSIVWKAVLPIEQCDISQTISYKILLENNGGVHKVNDEWQFYVPGNVKDESPKFAYASCNGFSDFKLMTSTQEPYKLWHKMREEHEAQPFSLMLLGGDQVYADSLWTKVNLLKDWNELGSKEKVKRKFTNKMADAVDRFFYELYVERWNREPFARMLAEVPSIMMWDDHDIFDGWGSYPEDIQTCDVYEGIFRIAKKYFSLLQIRGENSTLLSPDGDHFAMATQFRGYNILSLDHRSERTRSQVMSQTQWKSINDYLAKSCNEGDLLVLSAVPVVYRDFSLAEKAFEATPWEEELTDDLKDHWRAKEHQGERLRLVMRLLENAKRRNGKTVVLSGDVHIGCMGVIRDDIDTTQIRIHQVVSSGIVHPAPSYMQWLGILAVTNDDVEYLEETRAITATMISPHGSDKYIRERNFVSFSEGTDQKLWINWICDSNNKPVYPLR